MDDYTLPSETGELAAALRALVTPGLYAADLERSPLIDLPTVIARAGPRAPRTVRAQTFIAVVETVISTRLSKGDRAAASILFAVGEWSGVPVRERHHAVARLRNKHTGRGSGTIVRTGRGS